MSTTTTTTQHLVCERHVEGGEEAKTDGESEHDPPHPKKKKNTQTKGDDEMEINPCFVCVNLELSSAPPPPLGGPGKGWRCTLKKKTRTTT